MAKPFADVTAASHPARIHAAIMHAITAYDQRQARGKYYNPNALGLYCGAMNDAFAAVQGGTALRAALVRHFTGRLLDAVLMAVGESKSTDSEQRY